MRNAVHFLGGSIAVYLLMAACSAGSKSSGHGTDPGPVASQGGSSSNGGDTVAANAGTSSPNASGGDGVATSGKPAGGNASGGGLGGMIGDMMDPVDDADAAPATSGTRLRARYYIGEDGSKQFIGWHDKTRDEDCSFWKGTDGVLRCTPFYATSPPIYFGNADCTQQPLTVAAKATGSACGASGSPIKYTYLSDACGANRVRYTVSSQPTGGNIFQKSAATCTDVTAYLATTYDVYALSAPTAAPDSAFVAATEQVE
jgi:hypothetical protein